MTREQPNNSAIEEAGKLPAPLSAFRKLIRQFNEEEGIDLIALYRAKRGMPKSKPREDGFKNL